MKKIINLYLNQTWMASKVFHQLRLHCTVCLIACVWHDDYSPKSKEMGGSFPFLHFGSPLAFMDKMQKGSITCNADDVSDIMIWAHDLQIIIMLLLIYNSPVIGLEDKTVSALLIFYFLSYLPEVQ